MTLQVMDRAQRDGMTGVYNRSTAEKLIQERINEDSAHGIFIILDLDRLKYINDTYGHKQGDKAIIGIAKALKSHFRSSDIIGRIGGDEFIVYMPGMANQKNIIIERLTELLHKLDNIYVGENNEVKISCSIGCVVEQEDSTYESLYEQADQALYRIKRSGKNDFTFYTSADCN